MCWHTQLVLTGEFQLQPLGAFVFFATLLLYAMHRLVGLSRAEGFKDKGRYFVIERFQTHIGLYALLSGVGTLWFSWQLPWKVWWSLVPVALISMGYVLPIFGRGRRLRDFNYIKIFLIAICWSWITVYIPALELGLEYNIPLLFLFLERIFFIFAITLPFDIRDLEIDRANHVQTIPAVLGVRRSKILAIVALVISAGFAAFTYRLDAYSDGGFAGLISSLLITGAVVIITDPERHDYFFSGIVDGMMVLQFLLIWLGGNIG
ncbi:hypothetical protein CRP01_17155 [Flavilitoribacter nigricans DSM 23189 = NBRC 102662]|uniref:Prenyltransferase n=2 Tax=Flavilitoribacter TaxID=2762562 RepID=A0A2D0NA42_FLAN2|nr:hypothetical protein CRP01_17155 [Flavilitoribacter nigricans DSM 23189 = NBRC 102662]